MNRDDIDYWLGRDAAEPLPQIEDQRDNPINRAPRPESMREELRLNPQTIGHLVAQQYRAAQERMRAPPTELAVEAMDSMWQVPA